MSATTPASDLRNREATAPAPGRRGPTLRKRHYAIHAWAGFQLTLLTFVVLVTGTFATIGDEIDWSLDPAQRIVPQSVPPAWDAMFDTAQRTRPEHAIVQITLGEFASAAATVRTLTPGGHPSRILVHPATGELRGEAHWLGAQRILRDLHRYLLIVLGGIGLPIVSIAAGVLAVQLVTGLVNTRKWGRALVTVRARNARVLVGDLHRSAGVWAAWFVALMVLTSAWYLAEWAMLRLAGMNPEAERATAAAPPPDTTGALVWREPSAYIDAATAAYPELEPRSILFPTQADGAVTVMGRAGHPLVRDRAARVFLDPYDASVLRVQRPGSISVLAYVTELVDPLHFGDFGGLVSKWIWFGFGLVLSGLSASGVWLSWRRTGRLASRWHLATGGVLILSLVFGTGYLRRYLDDGLPDDARLVAEVLDGRWRIEAHYGAASGQARLSIADPEAPGTARPAIEAATLQTADGRRWPLRIRGGFAPLLLAGPAEVRPGERVLLELWFVRDEAPHTVALPWGRDT